MFQRRSVRYKQSPGVQEDLYRFITFTMCEMCPNTEFFLVHIFPHSDWIRRDTSYLSIFSPNAGKYRPEKIPYLDTFHAVSELKYFKSMSNSEDSFLDLLVIIKTKSLRLSYLKRQMSSPLLQYLCHIWTVVLHQMFTMHIKALKFQGLSELLLIVILS